MTMRNLPRTGVVVALALTLLTAGALPALAAPGRGGSGAAFAPWTVLQEVWAGVWGAVASVWAKEGSDMDPNGLPGALAGSDMDPDGIGEKAGSSMDPDGGPQGSSGFPGGITDQAGRDMDPDG